MQPLKPPTTSTHRNQRPTSRADFSQLLSITSALLLAAQPLLALPANTVLVTASQLDGLSPFEPRPITSWRWSPEQKANASRFSEMSIATDESGSRIWKVRVTSELPFFHPYLELISLGTNYLPPDADAIRLKVRAISGNISLTFGGPTAYFGNSDVFLRPIQIKASEKPSDWFTAEFSLHHGLIRNFRRSSFSRESPTIHYARWTQEPTYAYLLRGSAGEAHFKDIEIIAQGQSQPFPATIIDASKPPHAIVNVSSPQSSSRPFTALVGDTESEFVSTPSQHLPATMSSETDSAEGAVLKIRGRFSEEVSAVGFDIKPPASGDTFALRIKLDSSIPAHIAPDTPANPLDILIYESSESSRFEWKPFIRSDDTAHAGPARFDRNLTHANFLRNSDASVAIYHARRFLPQQTWTDLTIPLEDFVCIYAQGHLIAQFQNQQSPRSESLAAIALLPPWPRKGRPESTLNVQTIQLVTRLHPPLQRSYYQPPVRPFIKSAKHRFGFQLAPNESEIPAELFRWFAP